MDHIIEARNLKKYFDVRKSLLSFKKMHAKAVDNVNFTIRKKEVYGLIGESGCGKTTIGRMLLGLIPPTSGEVLFEQENIAFHNKSELRKLRQKVQMIFQDPYASMDPLFKIEDILKEPLIIHNICDKQERIKRVYDALELVSLTPPENFLGKRPHELSGGQRQRVAIARAMILNPKFLVADEPVSMLDVSIRVGILNLLLDIKEKMGVSGLYISHNISLVRYTCDRIAVMYLGKFCEEGQTDEVIITPVHPYTRSLIGASITSSKKDAAESKPRLLAGEVPSSINPPSGCRFHPRCKHARDICSKEEPQLIQVKPEHYVACHLVEEFM